LDRRWLDYTFRPSQIQSFQANVSGPTHVGRAVYLLSARRSITNDFAYATRIFEPSDTNNTRSGLLFPTGDFQSVPLGWSHEWSGVGKVSTKLLHDRVDVSYQAIVNVIQAQAGNWAFHLLPDGQKQQHTYSIVHGLDWNHTLSKKSFWTGSVRQNYFDYHDWAFADLYDPRYDRDGPLVPTGDVVTNACLQGVDFGRFVQNTNTLIAKASYVRQSTATTQLKFGGEFQLPRVYFGAPGTLVFTQSPESTSLSRKID